MKEFIPVGLFGISHHTASVEIREKAALSEVGQKEAIQEITNSFRIDGCFILSTCNRTEVYISSEYVQVELQLIRKWMDTAGQLNCFTDDKITYEKHGADAVEHFFRVISGLDSQIIGERQITGQVRDSYETSHKMNCTDNVLNRLFNFGMQVKRKVYNDTFLSDGTVSVSFAGVELARKIFSDLTDKEVLLIGAGKTAELAAYHFKEKSVRQINVANRTLSKAKKMAKELKGRAFQLNELSEALQQADIVISATSGKSFLLDNTIIKPVSKKRRHKPLFLIDLAIPRDINPEVNHIEGIYLYNLDDLHSIIKVNLEKRKLEIPKAMVIVREYIEEFRQWISTYAISTVIKRLKEHLEIIRIRELERFRKKLPSENIKEIDGLTQSIINKLLRQHIKLLKKNKGNPEQYQQQLDLIQNLYKPDND